MMGSTDADGKARSECANVVASVDEVGTADDGSALPAPAKPGLFGRDLPIPLVIGIVIALLTAVGIYARVRLAEENPMGIALAKDPFSPSKLRKMTMLVRVGEIKGGGPSLDGIPALVDPHVLKADEAAYLRASDRVLGVEIGGQARAYPLRVMIWHEIANDVIGGEPIVVTYCPLCDSAMAFDRRVGGQTREFGVSGKLYHSNMLLYDRQEKSSEQSLWSQIEMRALAGPAAEEGLELKLVNSELTTWGDWVSRHAETTVLSTQTGHLRDYNNGPYGEYFKHPEVVMVQFDADSGPAKARRPDLPAKAKLVAIEAGGERKIYFNSEVAEAARERGPVEDSVGGIEIRLTYVDQADSVRVEAVDPGEADQFRAAYSFWFAWEEMNPGTDIWEPDDPGV